MLQSTRIYRLWPVAPKMSPQQIRELFLHLRRSKTLFLAPFWAPLPRAAWGHCPLGPHCRLEMADPIRNTTPDQMVRTITLTTTPTSTLVSTSTLAHASHLTPTSSLTPTHLKPPPYLQTHGHVMSTVLPIGLRDCWYSANEVR